MTRKFSSKSTLAEALALPKGVSLLIKHKLPCPTCPMMASEAGQLTLGQICEMYGLELQPLLKDLNSAIKPSKGN